MATSSDKVRMPRQGRRPVSTGFDGLAPSTSNPSGVVDVVLDQEQVRMGSEVTGYVRLTGETLNTKVRVIFEGIEYTVVAFRHSVDNSMGIEYLRKHTSDRMVLTQQDMLLDCATPQTFRFSIPENLPGTMKYRVDGSHPILPSQCQISYTVSAVMYRGNSSETRVSKEVVIMPKKESDTPVDPFVTVSIHSVFDLIFKSAFSCGDSLCYVDQPDVESPLADEKYIVLEPNPSILHFSAGEPIKVLVRDRLGFISGPNAVSMVRLVEKLSWKAKGRIETSRQSWDLFADHHCVPTSLRRTYDNISNSLIKVEHEAIVYVVRKHGARQTILATTEPIQTTIVASSKGLYEA